MAEFEDGFGDGVFHEGVDALFLEVLDAGGGHGVVGDGEGEAGDDDVAESFAGDVDAGPEAVGAEEDTVGVFFEFFEHLMACHAAALDEELPVLAGAVVFEEVGHGLHLAVAGEEDKGAAVGEIEEVADAFAEGGLEVGGAGLGHGLDEIEAHLFVEIEGAFDAGGGAVFGADAAAEPAEFGIVSDGERGAGEDAGFAGLEEDVAQFG